MSNDDLTTKLAEALRLISFASMDQGARDTATEALRLYEQAKAQPKQAAEPVAQAEQWQSIETAPKDGRFVAVFPPSYSGTFSCAKWDTDKYSRRPLPFWKRTDCYRLTDNRAKQPTHWMPIPQPPKEQP